jgi:hypothetical protein
MQSLCSLLRWKDFDDDDDDDDDDKYDVIQTAIYPK